MIVPIRTATNPNPAEMDVSKFLVTVKRRNATDKEKKRFLMVPSNWKAFRRNPTPLKRKIKSKKITDNIKARDKSWNWESMISWPGFAKEKIKSICGIEEDEELESSLTNTL